jgi:hypothetical protein
MGNPKRKYSFRIPSYAGYKAANAEVDEKHHAQKA